MVTGLCPGGQKIKRDKERVADSDGESEKEGQMREKTQSEFTWHIKSSGV